METKSSALIIDGHHVELSFSDKRNTEVVETLKRIMLTSLVSNSMGKETSDTFDKNTNYHYDEAGKDTDVP